MSKLRDIAKEYAQEVTSMQVFDSVEEAEEARSNAEEDFLAGAWYAGDMIMDWIADIDPNDEYLNKWMNFTHEYLAENKENN